MSIISQTLILTGIRDIHDAFHRMKTMDTPMVHRKVHCLRLWEFEVKWAGELISKSFCDDAAVSWGGWGGERLFFLLGGVCSFSGHIWKFSD
jgi:hypothetical protein